MSDADKSVGGLDQPSDIGWSDPLPADRCQVVVGRLTGDRTPLSNVDRQVVLCALASSSRTGGTPTPSRLSPAGLEQFGCVSGKYYTDVVTDL